MDIVIEGPDNAGKSTLAKLIANEIDRPIVKSGGREKYAGEINVRITKFLRVYYDVIFDRHPGVSQEVYHLVVPNTRSAPHLMAEFWARNPFVIYCRGDLSRGMTGHIQTEADDPEYIAKVENRYSLICQAYDLWALQHAHMIYRIGDPHVRIIRAVKGVVGWNP